MRGVIFGGRSFDSAIFGGRSFDSAIFGERSFDSAIVGGRSFDSAIVGGPSFDSVIVGGRSFDESIFHGRSGFASEDWLFESGLDGFGSGGDGRFIVDIGIEDEVFDSSDSTACIGEFRFKEVEKRTKLGIVERINFVFDAVDFSPVA